MVLYPYPTPSPNPKPSPVTRSEGKQHMQGWPLPLPLPLTLSPGDGGCWDADAIRLVEQLGGSVEMVTTPGLLAEAFVTLPRAGAGH